MKILVLASTGPSSRILVNWLLASGLGEVRVVTEGPQPRGRMLSRRVRRLGLPSVMGQIAFLTLAVPVLRRAYRPQIEEIERAHGLSAAAIDDHVLCHVPSVNDPAVVEVLRAEAPDVVLVSATRILGRALLDAIPVPVVNIHTGITPAYRGVHGGYWALRSGDSAIFGVTIHLLDKGVDTGPVLAQVRCRPAPRDSFATYPTLQLAHALPRLPEVLANLRAGASVVAPIAPAPSRQWFHPTLAQYLTGLSSGIR